MFNTGKIDLRNRQIHILTVKLPLGAILCDEE